MSNILICYSISWKNFNECKWKTNWFTKNILFLQQIYTERSFIDDLATTLIRRRFLELTALQIWSLLLDIVINGLFVNNCFKSIGLPHNYTQLTHWLHFGCIHIIIIIIIWGERDQNMWLTVTTRVRIYAHLLSIDLFASKYLPKYNLDFDLEVKWINESLEQNQTFRVTLSILSSLSVLSFHYRIITFSSLGFCPQLLILSLKSRVILIDLSQLWVLFLSHSHFCLLKLKIKMSYCKNSQLNWVKLFFN